MAAPVLDRADVEDLTAQVQGPVLLRGDEGLEAEVAGFNAAVLHRPMVTVGASSADDVAAAVRWAADRGMPIAVQATGHGAAVPIEDAMLITTSRMRGVSVDPVAGTARIGAGAKWREVMAAAAPHGLAPLSGSSSDVGVVGYLTGGGLPLLGHAFGFGAERARAFDLVTPDGVLRRVDTEHEPDLFWALRGGKGSFGIVTAVEVDLLRISSVYGGGIFFEGSDAPSVFHAWREWVQTVPEAMCTSIALLRLPPLPDVPPPLAGKLAVHVRVAYVGDAAEGDRLLAPIRAAATPMMDLVGDLPMTRADEVHRDPEHPMPAWEKGIGLAELPAAAIDTLMSVVGPGHDVPLVVVEIRKLGGAFARQPLVSSAVSGRGAEYTLWTVGAFVPPIADAVPAAANAMLAAMAHYQAPHTPLNFLGADASPETVLTVWPAEIAHRLRTIKAEVDPQNLFRFGLAIPPAAVVPRQGGPASD